MFNISQPTYPLCCCLLSHLQRALIPSLHIPKNPTRSHFHDSLVLQFPFYKATGLLWRSVLRFSAAPDVKTYFMISGSGSVKCQRANDLWQRPTPLFEAQDERHPFTQHVLPSDSSDGNQPFAVSDTHTQSQLLLLKNISMETSSCSTPLA